MRGWLVVTQDSGLTEGVDVVLVRTRSKKQAERIKRWLCDEGDHMEHLTHVVPVPALSTVSDFQERYRRENPAEFDEYDDDSDWWGDEE